MKRPNEAQQARIKELADAAGGRLTPNLLLADATPPGSVLHDLLTWSDKKAAHQWRLTECRYLIRTTLYFEEGELQLLTPLYTRDPTVPAGQQGYVSLPTLRTDVAAARAAVRTECQRVESALLRAQRVAQVLECEDIIDDLLVRLAALKALVAEPDGDEEPPPVQANA